MLFSSIPFLYYFLPAVLVLYFLAPFKLKNFILCLASLFFYGWGESRYVFLMLISIVMWYALGLLLEKFRGNRAGKGLLVLSVVLHVGLLGYFKYADFFISNFNLITGLNVGLLRIALPIGISFYTFQILSYTIDVYRGEVKAQRNLLTLAAYISMFPQLIAGPIVRYSDIEKQLAKRTHSFDMAAEGIRRFLFGLSKKILIANALGECCANFKAAEEKDVLFFWLYAVSYMLHIYFDFSGYSDMAIGLGKILGFTFMENFNYPYISESITEFWRRWHISLGSWFRDYVYIPLGGNRVPKARWILNIAAVWFLTGFWHGAAWNFIFWGLYFAVFLLLEKLFLMPYIEKAKFANHIYVLFLVMLSFILFDAGSLPEAGANIAGLFGFGAFGLTSVVSIYNLKNYAVVLLVAIVAAAGTWKKVLPAIQRTSWGSKLVNIGEVIIMPILLLVITAYLVDGSFNPFLYFRF